MALPEETIETTFIYSATGERWGLFRMERDGTIRAAPIDQPYRGRQIYISPDDGGVRTGPACPPAVVFWFLSHVQMRSS